MATTKRTVFRARALRYYAQSWERVTLPRFVAPPVFIFLWILLGLLFAATLLAWLGQFPTYASGSGLVLDQGLTTSNGGDEAMAAIFLPASPSLTLRTGLPVQVQIGSTGPQLNTKIATVETSVMSPSAIRQRYHLTGALAAVITQPSIILTVQLGSGVPVKMYAGSLVTAQVQVGTERVLSLLPGLSQMIGA
jgi:hypothetical protein